MQTKLTADRLRDLMLYDQETGFLRWKRNPPRATKDGAAGRLDNDGYRRVRVDRRDYVAHRLAWLYVHGEWPAHQIDHINGDKTDNRLANLRDVPHAINVQNIRRAATGKKSCSLLGAFKHRQTNRWQARIRLKGKVISLGYFDTPEQANAAYVEGKRRLHEGCTI